MGSLREGLAKIQRELPFSLRENRFQVGVRNLRKVVDGLNLPELKASDWVIEPAFKFDEEAGQGITYAHDSLWFLTSSSMVFAYEISGPPTAPVVRRIAERSREDLIRECGLDPGAILWRFPPTSYFGDIEGAGYGNGLLWVPVECRNQEEDGILLMALSEKLEVVCYARPNPAIGSQFCAIHPWNHLLYMVNDDYEKKFKLSSLTALDPQPFLDVLQDRSKWRTRVQARLTFCQFTFYDEQGRSAIKLPGDWWQGLVFSPRGRVYVGTCDSDKAHASYLSVHDGLTGRRISVLDHFTEDRYEIEGFSLHPSGVLYVAICNNWLGRTDELHVRGFRHRQPPFSL